MKFLLTLYGDETTWGSLRGDESAAELQAFASFEREAADAGVLVTQEALQPPSEASTIRLRQGELATVDGPAREGSSQAGCFYVLECRDADEAVQWARKLPLVGPGGFDAVEVRPTL